MSIREGVKQAFFSGLLEAATNFTVTRSSREAWQRGMVQTLLVSPWRFLWFALMIKAFRGSSRTRASIASAFAEVVIFIPWMRFWDLVVAERPFQLQWPDLASWRQSVEGIYNYRENLFALGCFEFLCYRLVPRDQVVVRPFLKFVCTIIAAFADRAKKKQTTSAEGGASQP